MFKKKKNLSTPADTHLKELFHKYGTLRTVLVNKLQDIATYQKAMELLPNGEDKAEIKKACDKAKDSITVHISNFNTAKQDYEDYYKGSKNARVTTSSWQATLPDSFDVIFKFAETIAKAG